MVRMIILFIVLLVGGCVPSIVHNKSQFCLKEKPGQYYGNLKKDGYYYSISSLDASTGKRGIGIDMKILLNNGYIHNFKNGYGNQCGDSVSLDCEFKMSERLLEDYLNINKDRENTAPIALWNWGRYKVTDGRKITIQSFYNYFGDYYLLEENGESVDRNTFKISEKKDYRTGVTTKISKTYTFKEYDISKIYNRTPKNKIFKN